MNDPCKFCGMPVDSNCPCWSDNEDSTTYDYDDEYDDYDDEYEDDEYEEDE